MQQQVVLCDLVGTVYTSEGLIPGALDAIDRLRSQGHLLRFITNTDSKSTTNLLNDVTGKGVQVGPDELFTPVTAATALISAEPDARVLAMTTDEVAGQLAGALNMVDDLSATHVVVGDVRPRLDYDLLNLAYGALAGGAELVALQREPYFLSGGRRHLDTGAIVAALEFASGKQATVVGKPNPMFVTLALRSSGVTVESSNVWMIGDDRFSDVGVGRAAGINTVLVRTGKYADQAHLAGATEPDHIIDSLAVFPDLLTK